MTRQVKAKLITSVVLAATMGVVVYQKNRDKLPGAMPAVVMPKAEPTPQDAVYAMLDAARAGDVAKYLDCYSGQMLVSLKQAVTESGNQKFADYLKQTNQAVKGVALMDLETINEREMKMRVEYIYQDRNETQTVHLERGGPNWKIVRVDGAERLKTLVPYGTPVQ